jgi:outer membrane biosynthesis protein TonB
VTKTRATNRLLLICVIAAIGSSCSAETRWCSISGKAKSNSIFYPPIARAAHISGTVVSRMTFAPSGDVIEMETVFGPPLLATSANAQMKSWTVQTNAAGAEPCQSLIILNFAIGETESVEQLLTLRQQSFA